MEHGQGMEAADHSSRRLKKQEQHIKKVIGTPGKPKTTSFKTIEALMTIFVKYGLPEQLVSDNGPQFTSEEFTEFMKVNSIKHIRSAPYHPSTNGLEERFVQTFKRAMKNRVQDEPNLSTPLSQFLLGYRSAPHATTKVSPEELFLQQKLREC